MNKGFTQSVIDAINSANPKHLGVQLGKLMIHHRMSTAEAAKYLKVTRNSAHALICGRSWPRQSTAERIEQLIDLLKNKQ